METRTPTGELRTWYVGEAGDLAARLGQYRQPDENGLDAARRAHDFRTALLAGETGHLKLLLRADLQIPARLFDEDGDPLSWDAGLEDTALRVLVESAVVVHQTQSMIGNWEVRLNRLGRRKGTRKIDSPLDDVVFEFHPLPDAFNSGREDDLPRRA